MSADEGAGDGADGVPHDVDPFLLMEDDVAARLLGEPRSMRRREVSASAQIGVLGARKFWHALGFPNVRDRDTVFTDADLDALRTMVSLVQRGVFDESTALAMTRALGRTADRLATWQTQLLAEVLQDAAEPAQPRVDDEASGRPLLDPGTARETALLLVDLADELEPLLVYAWRRHLSAAISRMLADAEPAEDHAGIVRTVGFADLVSFTELVRRLSERQLARVVQRFEALASSVVTAHGGRVIKTVGDEVMYVTSGAAPGAAVALDLVAAMAEDDILPEVRVGMACGRVLSRLGDVFGTTVNRAARLTSVARPGTVLVDDRIATELATGSGFEMTALPARELHGLGPVTPWTLRRAADPARRGRTDEGDA